MATNPANQQQAQLPLFYNSLAPLSSQLHPEHGLVQRSTMIEARGVHAVPVTVDEFALAQRHFPIVFGPGPEPVPLALMGLNEGVNLFVDDEGTFQANVYIPAYMRRYPFMLAKLSPEATELSLCFDDQSGLVKAGEGDRLFDGTEPSELTKNILGFCEQFEQSVARTRAFMAELVKLELIQEGEFKIQQPGLPDSSYRGFGMVAEDKLQELRGDQARKMVQNGMLGLIYAHLFSLSNIRELYAKQSQVQAPAAAPATN
jgi:hypothetical protein